MASWRQRPGSQGSGCCTPERVGVTPALPRRTCHRDAGGAPGWARLAGPGAWGGACLLLGAGRRPEARASGEGRAGAGTPAEATTCAARPGQAPAGRRYALAGPAGDSREGGARRWGGGPEVGFGPPPALALGIEGGTQCAPCPGTAPGLSRYLPFCPSQENQAPSRPFERWILLTYLAALARGVESWVLPDLAGIFFVRLSKSRIPLEQGECLSAPWEPRCPTVPRPGVATPAPAFYHVKHQAAFRLHFFFFLYACISVVPFAEKGVIAFLRIGSPPPQPPGLGLALCVCCLPFKPLLLFRISSAWVGKWHSTTVVGEGSKCCQTAAALCFPIPSPRSGFGAPGMGGETDRA